MLANIDLGGGPSGLILKPDGGELYVPSPEVHGLVILNTQTNEVAEFLLLGLAPSQAVLTADAAMLYASDSAAGRVIAVNIFNRQVITTVSVGQNPGAIALTPDEDIVLVVDQDSNDLAVLRTRSILQQAGATAPPSSLITLIPVGRRPRDLAIKGF